MSGWLMLFHVGGMLLWAGGFLGAGWSLTKERAPALERRLLLHAAWPGLLTAAAAGLLLLYRGRIELWPEPWMKAKLGLSAVMVAATAGLSVAHARGGEGAAPRAAGWHRAGLAAAASIVYLSFIRPF